MITIHWGYHRAVVVPPQPLAALVVNFVHNMAYNSVFLLTAVQGRFHITHGGADIEYSHRESAIRDRPASEVPSRGIRYVFKLH